MISCFGSRKSVASDAAMSEWVTGHLADSMNRLGPVVDDYQKDNLFGEQDGNRIEWHHQSRFATDENTAAQFLMA